MKITIVGTGYVGLVSGTCFAEVGHEVMCIDIDIKKIENLKKGIIPIYEPGLSELVVRNIKEKRLYFSTNISEGIEFSDIIFSAVGTPPDKNHKADLQYVISVAKSFGKNMKNGDSKIFVNKSTVPVGTADICNEIISDTIQSRNIQASFFVCSNPEFLREGAAIKDTMNPDRIVVGTDSIQVKEVMEKIYKPFIRTHSPLIFTDIKSAEIIKYASNAFLATKISFINEVANFVEIAGGNIQEIAKGMGLDQRIGGRFLHAGIGYGGSCFPKDVQALIETGKEKGYSFQILESVEKVNKKQKQKLFDRLIEKIPNLKDKKIGILGLSFKPKTDDMRDAPSLDIINLLIQRGAIVHAFDPVATENAKNTIPPYPHLYYFDTCLDAIKNTDAILIVTEWDEFRGLDPKEIKSKMQGNIVIDGRNIFSPEEMKMLGFEYSSIGRYNS